MSDNTTTTSEASPFDALMDDVLQRARAFLETNDISNDNTVNFLADDVLANDVDEGDIPSRWDMSDNEDAEYTEPDMVNNEIPRWNNTLARNYCGIRWPLGLYDPFNETFPWDGVEEEWGDRAVSFFLTSLWLLPIPQWQNAMFDSICDPEELSDSLYDRAWSWWNALPLDVQVEVYLQRTYELRPRSLWIMGPHDDSAAEWGSWCGRYEIGRCIIPQVRFWGWEYSYWICGGRTEEPNEGEPEWWTDPAARSVPTSRRRRRPLVNDYR